MTMPYRFRHLLPIDLDDEQLERLERLARNQGRSVEEVISDAVAQYLLRESDLLNQWP
jgi:predicted transcriptional regulator